MLPLSLLRTGQGHQIMVELKNGETYNGILVNCDNWMNINMRTVIRTSKDSDKFWKLQGCYIRGNTIKYITVPDEIIDLVAEEEQKQQQQQQQQLQQQHHHHQDKPMGRGRGSGVGRGRGGNQNDGNMGRGRGGGGGDQQGSYRGGRGGRGGGSDRGGDRGRS
ncbi:LSM domain-containing protein [Cavenderia fasciculata]|uniref:U6 snRNA-associated Sm-like protein LSm4 n=1 Tax=Cavenderia fasciculata TaxID=261658 RepID=F4PIA5_CACFS|nr:LSM domain-containing protein [Cavenderia fasciculata]EGG24539.1 LSM domain-containing protein [Cavenderia fasciculata]|eukprot:XP_004362390.1 LSM domain-containing protein [Cavenderia fasciculata]